MLAPFEDVQRLLMNFPADGIAVGARCGQEKPQRLFSRVAAALRHDVVEGARGLGVQLVEDAGGHIQAVLGGHLAGEHLIDAARGLVDHALHGGNDLNALHERRGLPDHVHGHVEHDGRLLAVGCTGVDLRLPFIVVDQHIERDGCAQLAVVRRYHRRPGEILMRRAVHLYAAHLYPVRKRLDVLQVMKTGARLLCALPFPVIFSFQARSGLVFEGRKADRVQRLAGRLSISQGRPHGHGVLDAEAPQQFAHGLGQLADGADVYALRLLSADTAVRIHESL